MIQQNCKRAFSTLGLELAHLLIYLIGKSEN
jgi:hypothetical protein